jgi:hypothetical protein
MVLLGSCSLFSKDDSKATTTTTTTAPASTSSTTQPAGDAGPEVLKPVLDALVKEEAILVDALLFNKGEAWKDENSPERAAYLELFTNQDGAKSFLASMGEPISRGRYLAPVPGEDQATFAWVLDVFPKVTPGYSQGSLDEVEFTGCSLSRGIVVDEAGNKLGDANSVAADRTLARRQDGVWKIDSGIDDLDPRLCDGGPPT